MIPLYRKPANVRKVPAVHPPVPAGHRRTGVRRAGFSLLELMLVFTVIGILVSMSAPSFYRSIEQSHADIAAANLRAIWSAERLYWLEYRTYTGDLSELQALGLIDPVITSPAARYVYAVPAADDATFTATATHSGSELWSGQFTVTEDGTLSGVVQATGKPDIVPGFQ